MISWFYFFIFPLNFGQENIIYAGWTLSGYFLLSWWWFDQRLRSPKDFLDLVHRHYDSYPHQQSGLVSGEKKEFTTVRILSIWARIAVGDIGPGVLGAWLNCEGRMPTVSWERTVQWDSQSNWWNSLPLRIPSFSGPLIYANNVFYFCCSSSVLFSTKVWTYMI